LLFMRTARAAWGSLFVLFVGAASASFSGCKGPDSPATAGSGDGGEGASSGSGSGSIMSSSSGSGSGSSCGTTTCNGGPCNDAPAGLLNPDYTTTWNPGILADTPTGNA